MDICDIKEISLADLPTTQGLLHNTARNSKYSSSFYGFSEKSLVNDAGLQSN